MVHQTLPGSFELPRKAAASPVTMLAIMASMNVQPAQTQKLLKMNYSTSSIARLLPCGGPNAVGAFVRPRVAACGIDCDSRVQSGKAQAEQL